MDGSPLMSSATQGSPNIEGQNFEQGDNLNFVAGTGTTLTTGKSGTTHTVTYTNSDRGSSQPIFKNVQLQTHAGTTITTHNADNNNDTIVFRPVRVGGSDGIILSSLGDDIVGIQHADTSSQASVNNSGGNVIQDIVLDTYGHVTGISTVGLDTRYAGISNTVNLTGNQTISGTKTFSSQIH